VRFDDPVIILRMQAPVKYCMQAPVKYCMQAPVKYCMQEPVEKHRYLLLIYTGVFQQVLA
jgi:hypothetical protein